MLTKPTGMIEIRGKLTTKRHERIKAQFAQGKRHGWRWKWKRIGP